MRFVRWIKIIMCVTGVVCVTGVTGCVSPMYDTARTYPGLTVGGGLAYQIVDHEGGDIDVKLSGIRPDISLTYAPTNWFSFVGRAGVLIQPDQLDEPFPFAGLGFKVSTPWERFNLGIRAEVDLPRYASFAPMAGFSNSKGHEYLTLGFQTVLGYMPATFFVNMHPLPGTHIFAGAVWPQKDVGIPEACVGLGYTYTFSKKNKEDKTKTE
ncbi:MAG: hypothetical protein U9Q76_00820 [candidate division WOR-3 bacterium]|nr:hypothetical protein [candidate division WOR-3 bacterium]